jgi:formate dehydrogenase subunit gamma
VNQAARIDEIVAAHAHREGPLLPVLREVQAELGCVSAEAVAQLAAALNLTRAEVHGVVSFYHDLSERPDPRPCVEICRAEACQARGVEALMDEARVAAGERVRLADVYCLGLCSVGPNAKLGDEVYARLDAAGLASLIASA